MTEFLTIGDIYHDGDCEPLLMLPFPPAATRDFLAGAIDALNAFMGDLPRRGNRKAWRARPLPGGCTRRPLGLSRSPC